MQVEGCTDVIDYIFSCDKSECLETYSDLLAFIKGKYYECGDVSLPRFAAMIRHIIIWDEQNERT